MGPTRPDMKIKNASIVLNAFSSHTGKLYTVFIKLNSIGDMIRGASSLSLSEFVGKTSLRPENNLLHNLLHRCPYRLSSPYQMSLYISNSIHSPYFHSILLGINPKFHIYFENSLYLRICDALEDAEDASLVWICAASQHDGVKRVLQETKNTKLFIKKDGMFRRDFAMEEARKYLDMPPLVYADEDSSHRNSVHYRES